MLAPPPPNANTYWVVPHKLLAGEYPGDKDPGKAREKINRLVEAGVRHFVDLTGLGELIPYEAILSEESRAANVIATHQRIPIRDESVPKEPKTMAEIIAAIHRGMAGSGITYVHCWGGVGRTGLAVACWLQERGQTPDEALTELADRWRSCAKSKWRPNSPQTAEQVRWVKEWPVYRSTLKSPNDP